MRNTKRKNVSYIEEKGIIQLVNENMEHEEMKEYALQETDEEAPKEAVADFWSNAVQMDEDSKQAAQERIEDVLDPLEVVSVSTTSESENKMEAIERAKQALAAAEKAKADAEEIYFQLIENSRSAIIADMRNGIAEYRIKPVDLFPDIARSIVARERIARVESEDGDVKEKKERAPVAIKYRDVNGNTWTGRGKQPRWIAAAIANGKTLTDFLV